jgi:hypothetical protein
MVIFNTTFDLKFIPENKVNSRDLTTWVQSESVYAYTGSEGVPGVIDFVIEYLDSPDRYVINSEIDESVGRR